MVFLSFYLVFHILCGHGLGTQLQLWDNILIMALDHAVPEPCQTDTKGSKK